MKTRHFRRTVRGALLAFSLLFGIAVTSATTVRAQSPYGYGGQDRHRGRDRNRDSGRHDRRDDRHDRRDNRHDRRDDNYGRNGGYGRSNGGYGRSNGGYGTYGGYGRGNGGYGSYGGYGGYGNDVYRVAQDRGYQHGASTGASDANRGQSYNPQRSHYYKSGTSGYSSSYGNKEGYKQAYRDGFLRGYEQGYRQYGGGYYGQGGYGRGGTRSRAGTILGTILGRPY